MVKGTGGRDVAVCGGWSEGLKGVEEWKAVVRMAGEGMRRGEVVRGVNRRREDGKERRRGDREE